MDDDDFTTEELLARWEAGTPIDVVRPSATIDLFMDASCSVSFIWSLKNESIHSAGDFAKRVRTGAPVHSPKIDVAPLSAK